ncbi:unnamed protein product [Orchesella dallaii]|uniref:Uncharacterized protein n=1 Tax=Orchesella dallaii TaxID=48710 RepID=A0ABP1RWD7_9HEXA
MPRMEYITNIINNHTGNNESYLNTEALSFSLNTSDLNENIGENASYKNWGNWTFALSEWQKSQLGKVGQSKAGVSCLLNEWFSNQTELEEGIELEDSYCNATWDNVYCWPKTPSGSIISRPCTEVLQVADKAAAEHIQGNAIRVCLENGTWLWGNWTNYTECADSYDEFTRKTEEERLLVVTVQYILFIGSILSVICLSISLVLFFYFRCLWCDRVKIYTHLMSALILRCALLIVITEPFIFERTNHYRTVDIACKAVLSLNLYGTVASINWMFIQGLYLHGKVTTNVFDRKPPFKLYYLIGWVLPLLLVVFYAVTEEVLYPIQCWKDYSERSEIWILLGPMIVALLANLLFLINIMRIMLTKIQLPNSSSDSAQLRRAVKATFVLFPLLGINNLLFLYNPGGEYNRMFVLLNTGFGSTQGIFVSILYCFVSKDVREAIRRRFRRFRVHRNGYSIRSRETLSQRNVSVVNTLPTSLQTKTQFRVGLQARAGADEQNSWSATATTGIEINPSSGVVP